MPVELYPDGQTDPQLELGFGARLDQTEGELIREVPQVSTEGTSVQVEGALHLNGGGPVNMNSDLIGTLSMYLHEGATLLQISKVLDSLGDVFEDRVNIELPTELINIKILLLEMLLSKLEDFGDKNALADVDFFSIFRKLGCGLNEAYMKSSGLDDFPEGNQRTKAMIEDRLAHLRRIIKTA